METSRDRDRQRLAEKRRKKERKGGRKEELTLINFFRSSHVYKQNKEKFQ